MQTIHEGPEELTRDRPIAHRATLEVSSQGRKASTTIAAPMATTPPSLSGWRAGSRRTAGSTIPARCARRHQRVGRDVVVGMAHEVRLVEDEIGEHDQEHDHAEHVLDRRVGRERHGVLGNVLDLDAGRVVLADDMQRPDVQDHHAEDHERQQVVQREEAVQRRVVDGKPPQRKVTIVSPMTGSAENRLVMTVAPQKDICPQGRT
jgi:hypothetical protein